MKPRLGKRSKKVRGLSRIIYKKGHKKRPLDCSKGLKEGGDPDESGQALLSHAPWRTSNIGAAGLIRRGGSGWEERNGIMIYFNAKA